MRLINTTTLDLHEFFDADIPRYAILSHRWGKEEVTFKDWQKRRSELSIFTGYWKVLNFCKTATEYRCKWAWVDTVCIDKRSSAELSEAINSMYQYYANATICIVQLVDVRLRQRNHKFRHCMRGLRSITLCDACGSTLEDFRSSDWFRRGWTLQELIAPELVGFFDVNWKLLGSKYSDADMQTFGGISHRLVTELEGITGIPRVILAHKQPLFKESVAHRLGYASNRDTTRLEDGAYCLMGILGINMPLLYGEGQRAWLRLQEEVIRTSNDESIFVWKANSMYQSGMLAETATLFQGVSAMLLSFTESSLDRPEPRTPYAMTNQGIEMRLRAKSVIYAEYRDPDRPLSSFKDLVTEFLVVPLNCGAITSAPADSYRWYLIMQEKTCGHYIRIAAVQGPGNAQTISGPGLHVSKYRGEDSIYVHASDPVSDTTASEICRRATRDWILSAPDFSSILMKKPPPEVDSS